MKVYGLLMVLLAGSVLVSALLSPVQWDAVNILIIVFSVSTGLYAGVYGLNYYSRNR